MGLEIGHALRRAIRTTRITEKQADAAYGAFLAWGLPVEEDSYALRLSAWTITNQYGCSFYDASYLATALLRDLPLIHADERLKNTLAGRFRGELSIADYEPVPSPANEG